MNKLTTEHKKLLAEKVMGLKADYITFSANYNPDQDTPEGLAQFVELIGKLDVFQKHHLNDILSEEYEIIDIPSVFVWFCKNKYKVCMAIIEVIK